MAILTRQLLLQILKVLVAVSIRANQGSGFGITCNASVPPFSCPPIAQVAVCQEKRTDILLRARNEAISLYSGKEAIGGGGHFMSVPPFGGHSPRSELVTMVLRQWS